MKAPPLELGGRSPVVAYLKHSMMVVFPDPFWPTIRVRGLEKVMVSRSVLSKERMPWIESWVSQEVRAEGPNGPKKRVKEIQQVT